MTIDFANAKAAHLSWRGRLLGYLQDGTEMDEAKAISARRCDVGMWLYGSALDAYGTNPAVRRLEQVHAAMHAAVGKTIQAKRACRMSQAETELETVRVLSLEVVALLNQLEAETTV